MSVNEGNWIQRIYPRHQKLLTNLGTIALRFIYGVCHTTRGAEQVIVYPCYVCRQCRVDQCPVFWTNGHAFVPISLNRRRARGPATWSKKYSGLVLSKLTTIEIWHLFYPGGGLILDFGYETYFRMLLLSRRFSHFPPSRLPTWQELQAVVPLSSELLRVVYTSWRECHTFVGASC